MSAPRNTSSSGGAKKRSGGMFDILAGLAKGNGADRRPGVRQDLVRLYSLNEIGRINGERVKAARAQGQDIPGMANIS